MAKQSITTLKNWFKRGLKPLESQFADWMDSYWHKDAAIPISSVDGLEDVLNILPDLATIELVVSLVKERGVSIVANTTALQAQSGNDTKLVLVKGLSIFTYETTGTVDGINVFAATGGGFWVNALPSQKRVTANISGAVNLDLSTGDIFHLTLTGNVTSLDYSNAILGKTYVFEFIKETTEYTLVWAAGKYRFSGGGIIELTDPTTNGTAPASSRDIITAICTEAGKLNLVHTPDLIEN